MNTANASAILWWYNATAPLNHFLKSQPDGGVRCICDRLVIAPSGLEDGERTRELVRQHWNEERK